MNFTFWTEISLIFSWELHLFQDSTTYLNFIIFSCRVHNEVCPSCDIASQRMFRGGRTEYIRSPTNQTLKFILAFDDQRVSVRNGSVWLVRVFLTWSCFDLMFFSTERSKAGAAQRSSGCLCRADYTGNYLKKLSTPACLLDCTVRCWSFLCGAA